MGYSELINSGIWNREYVKRQKANKWKVLDPAGNLISLRQSEIRESGDFFLEICTLEINCIFVFILVESIIFTRK